MTNRLESFSFAFILGLLIPLLTACGDSGTTSQNGNASGSVAVLLTDAPIDDFDQFWVTVNEMSLLDEDSSVSLFSGSETINLLDLNSHSSLFSLADNIPAGNYQKIRMQITDPQLIKLDSEGNVLESVIPNMSGNGKLDLNPRSQINVVAGETLVLQLDMDANKSIHLIQNGNGDYRFRPVVFIDVLSESLTGKLVRINGIVGGVDEASNSFELCQTGMAFKHNDDEDEADDDEEENELNEDTEHYDDDSTHCINVVTTSETSYFDATGNSVAPVMPATEEPLTVLGYYHDLEDEQLRLNAQVIELATANIFTQFKGTVESLDLVNHQFVMRNSNDELLTIVLSEASKFFTMSGAALTQDDLQLNSHIKVEGVLYPVESLIKAAVVFVDDLTQEVEQLSGNIITLHDDQRGFDINDETLGDRCVSINEDSNIYLLTIVNSSFNSEITGFSTLQSGQHLEAYGEFNQMGCFEAENILLENLP